MTLDNQHKLNKHIFRLLKVNEIVIPIGRTNKGNLGLKFSENNDSFEIMLDAVPLSTEHFLEDDNNIELKKMLEKYLFEDERKNWEMLKSLPAPKNVESVLLKEVKFEEPIQVVEKKKRGRPAKAK